MKPAISIILFTTLAGAAQGIAVVLGVATIAGAMPAGALTGMLWTTTAMLVMALAASFFHLGHPLRAWRAVLMWRTSWMSREVIVLPAFMGTVASWALLCTFASEQHPAGTVFAWIAIAGALALWGCTAMIYACIRFIPEWAHPLTLVNYLAIGMSSGLVAAGGLAILMGHAEFAQAIAGWALAATTLAWFTRILSLHRNDRLRPRSTIQSATGIHASRVSQVSMGMTGGSFNTRDFFHGVPAALFQAARTVFLLLGFLVPLALLAWVIATGEVARAWPWALASQAVGLLAERWYFFAQSTHPQNIYYQTVS
jgi:DMSO reductase anchor subunit